MPLPPIPAQPGIDSVACWGEPVAMRRGWIIAGVVLAALALGAFLKRDELALDFAILTWEHRPSLLSDAEWNKPASAVKFNRNFPKGSREQALTDWLTANRFKIDAGARKAERSIESLPCNEWVNIDWAATPGGAITRAEATVSEAGCF